MKNENDRFRSDADNAPVGGFNDEQEQRGAVDLFADFSSDPQESRVREERRSLRKEREEARMRQIEENRAQEARRTAERLRREDERRRAEAQRERNAMEEEARRDREAQMREFIRSGSERGMGDRENERRREERDFEERYNRSREENASVNAGEPSSKAPWWARSAQKSAETEKSEVKPEASAETKPEGTPEGKPEAAEEKADKAAPVQAEVKSETTEIKPEASETKPADAAENDGVSRDDRPTKNVLEDATPTIVIPSIHSSNTAANAEADAVESDLIAAAEQGDLIQKRRAIEKAREDRLRSFEEAERKKAEEAEKKRRAEEQAALQAEEEKAAGPRVSRDEGKKEIKKFTQITAAICAALFLIVFSVGLLNYLKAYRENHPKDAKTDVEESVAPSFDSAEIIGVVLKKEGAVVQLYNAPEERTIEFDLDDAKKITDRYGNDTVPENITVGTIVKVQYNSANNRAEHFRITAQSTELKEVSGIAVKDGEVTVDGTVYQTDRRLISTYQGRAFDLSNLSEKCVVNISAYENHIYTLRVLYCEAELEINTIPASLEGATLTLAPASGPEITLTLHTAELPLTISVTEGRLHYIVRKNGKIQQQDDIITDISDSTELQLKEQTENVGIVSFNANVKSAEVTVGDATVQLDTELSLPYGEYEATVVSTGYKDLVIRFIVNQPYKIIDVDMNASTSKLVIASSFSGSVVFINDQQVAVLRGTTYACDLDPGNYEIRVENEGYQPMTMHVSIKANEADKVLYFTGFSVIIPEPESFEPEPESSEPESESSEPESSEPEPESSEPEPESSEPEPESSEPESQNEPEPESKSEPESKTEPESEAAPIEESPAADPQSDSKAGEEAHE